MKKRSRRTRGEGAVRKLPSGGYEARITIGYDSSGKRIRKNLYADSQDVLLAMIARVRQQQVAKPRYYSDAERLTLAAFLAEWLETDVRANNKPATYRLREATCRNHIVPYIGKMKLAHVEDNHVRGLLRMLRERRVGARTRQVVHATLHCLFEIAVRDKLLSANPLSHVEKPKAPKREKLIFSEAEAKLFIEAARGDQYEALYVLALMTGMREGELFALDWRNVDLQDGVIRVRANLALDLNSKLVRDDTKTTSSWRVVDLPKIAIDALKDHKKKVRGFDGLVFRDSKGGPLRKSNFLRRHYHPLLERWRVCLECDHLSVRDGAVSVCPACQGAESRPRLPRVTFHALRHVVNSILLSRGVNVRLLADRLGHSTTRTTLEHYSHVMPDARREAARSLDDLFGT